MSVRTPEAVSPATTISRHQIFVTALDAMLKFFIPAQDEGDREDDFEELGSRDRVISKTAFGSIGEREKIKVEAQTEF